MMRHGGAPWAGAVVPCPEQLQERQEGRLSVAAPFPPLCPTLPWMNPAPLLLASWQVSAVHTVQLPQTCPRRPHLATPTCLRPGPRLCKKPHMPAAVRETANEAPCPGGWGGDTSGCWSRVTRAWGLRAGLSRGQKAPDTKGLPGEVRLVMSTNCHGKGLVGAKKRCSVRVT